MRALSIVEMQQLARKRGGQCLSRNYRNNYSALRWRCHKRHVWTALPKAVKQGHWCDRCFDDARRGSIDRIRKIAERRGGICLSSTYPNVKALLKIRCAQGHVWSTTGNALLRGSWCGACAGRIKHSLAMIRALAMARGGKCLSASYKNAHAKLEWRCSEGHRWSAAFHGIRSGGWCPDCSVFLRERLVRRVFETLFSAQFPRVRPAWLLGPRGYKMELDGFCAKLRIAFEHHGEQHYAVVKRFQAGTPALIVRRRADAYKRALCRRRGIRLVEVPYTVPVKDLAKFIVAECRRQHIPVRLRAINLDSAFPNQELKALRTLAKSRGGACLSPSYRGTDVRLKWRCKDGHSWAQFPWKIKRGYWCPDCIQRQRKAERVARELERLRQRALSLGGRCLAKVYVESQRSIEFACRIGHQWFARPANVIRGSWCPECWRKRKGDQAILTPNQPLRRTRAQGGSRQLIAT